MTRNDRHLLQVFDDCHKWAKDCRLKMQSARSSFPDGMPHGGGLPIVGNCYAEYRAQFDNAGKKALKLWPRRMSVFQAYFVRGDKPAKTVCLTLLDEPKVFMKVGGISVPEGTWKRWCVEIKRRVAPELKKRGLYPPREYRIPEWQRQPEDVSQYSTTFWSDYQGGGD